MQTIELFPERVEERVAEEVAVDRALNGGNPCRAQLFHATARFLGGKFGVVRGHEPPELEALGIAAAEPGGPVIVGPADTVRELPGQFVVAQYQEGKCRRQHSNVDALDVHALEVDLRRTAAVCLSHQWHFWPMT